MRAGFSLVSFTLALALYAIIGVHFYAFVVVICPLIKGRMGTELGLVWIAVGLSLCYGIVFNHFWAMVIKPGSTKDQKIIEKMRQAQKQRAHRKSVDLTADADETFQGLSSEVKKLVRYRSKTVE